MNQPYRLTEGGLIDRQQRVNFRFNNKTYQGFVGDTLASALLANGVHLMGRSFKYHRPRGVVTAGSDEPNALMQLRQGAYTEPNTRATVIELFEGLEASSQNHWPSLARDFLAINDRLSNLLSAGFYYKTFMWPKSFWEKVYEPAIRRAAGLGEASTDADPDTYERVSLHCDVLIVGAGLCGLLAAQQAATAGLRVAIVDEQADFGGSLRSESLQVDEQAASTWAWQLSQQLRSLPNVTCLSRTSAFGYFDHHIVGCVERVNDHVAQAPAHAPRQRLWRIHSQRVVLATGALERSLVFNGNDVPGVMLASAVRAYTNQYAVKLGDNVCLFTNNDAAYQTIFDLLALGLKPLAVIDSRDHVDKELLQQVRDAGVELYTDAHVINTKGRLRLQEIEVKSHAGNILRLKCDVLAVSGGWNPNVQLSSHMTAKAQYNEAFACFVPGEPARHEVSIGAAAGIFDAAQSLQHTQQVMGELLAALQGKGTTPDLPHVPALSPRLALNIQALWRSSEAYAKAFVDLQNDVTAKDIVLAVKEGFSSVEHLKRYTTLGMATDQGKGANVNGLAILADELGEPIPQVGTTRFRPPVTPVALGVLAGHSRGKHMAPTRKTTTHAWAERHRAVFTEAGQWLRAWYYPQGQESLSEAAYREAVAARTSVGICDVSTLGKIEVQGKDAAEFLNRLYSNNFASLKVGKARYGLMLREDGMVMDDGTTSRFAEDHYFMTTTTANAGKVMAWMEQHLQITWPELDVQVASVTEQWAGFAIAGPQARQLLQQVLGDDMDVRHERFPFLGAAEFDFSATGTKARLFRISFSGELAYELYVPAHYGESLWEALIHYGADYDVTPYGMEALGIMRIEKGHVAGPELSGNTTADDIGLGKMAGQKKPYIGRYLLQREALQASDREVLVGLESIDQTPMQEGSHIVHTNAEALLENDLGYITSATWSPNLNKFIALALIRNGREMLGKPLKAVNPLHDSEVRVKVVSPHFYDPDNERLMQ